MFMNPAIFMSILHRSRLAFFLGMLVLMCFSSCHVAAEPDQDAEAEIYAAYIDFLAREFPSNKSLVIKPTTVLLLKNLFDGDDPLFEIRPGMPGASEMVISEFLRVGGDSVPLNIPHHLVRPGIRYSLANGKVLRRIFHNQHEESAWRHFYRANPSANGLLAFSRVGIDPERNHALFYVEYSCGVLCGAGYLVFLQRQSGGWRVVVNKHLYVT
jgi:hypothetical protein